MLDDATELAQAVDVGTAAAGDPGQDADVSQLPVNGFVVVAVVAEQGIQASTAGGTLSAEATVW
ncbi:hypothetical protein [Kitasatospora sp. NPDC101183]|uniref:hypothetical protein n=1 Tax=Kitasatospora sp. NPDC101183 TaxID=3364100 RepID=UPI00382A64FD